jgi:hypothetical protein
MGKAAVARWVLFWTGFEGLANDSSDSGYAEQGMGGKSK